MFSSNLTYCKSNHIPVSSSPSSQLEEGKLEEQQGFLRLGGRLPPLRSCSFDASSEEPELEEVYSRINLMQRDTLPLLTLHSAR